MLVHWHSILLHRSCTLLEGGGVVARALHSAAQALHSVALALLPVAQALDSAAQVLYSVAHALHSTAQPLDSLHSYGILFCYTACGWLGCSAQELRAERLIRGW